MVERIRIADGSRLCRRLCAGVIFGSNGALYSTTVSGGTPAVLCHSNTRIKYGCGTLFQLTPPAQSGGAWTETVLHTFPALSKAF